MYYAPAPTHFLMYYAPARACRFDVLRTRFDVLRTRFDVLRTRPHQKTPHKHLILNVFFKRQNPY